MCPLRKGAVDSDNLCSNIRSATLLADWLGHVSCSLNCSFFTCKMTIVTDSTLKDCCVFGVCSTKGAILSWEGERGI